MRRPTSDGVPSGPQAMNEDLPVTDLAGRVTEIFTPREKSDRVLFLAAHERLNYEGVMRILDFAKSGVEGLRIGMVTNG